MRQVAVGEIVALRSGGKPMTVVVVCDGRAEVAWMDKDLRIKRDRFPIECLRVSDGEFDGVGDLMIEGVTHSREEIDAYLGRAGNA